MNPNMDLSLIPSAPPPPGVKSNFVNPPSLYSAVLAVNLVFMPLAITPVIMRLVMNGRKVRAADVCCVLGLIFSLAYSILLFDWWPVGRHNWDVPLSWDFNPHNIWDSFATGLTSGFAPTFAKTSIFLLYRDVFKVSKALNMAILAGIVATVVIYIPFVTVFSYYCTPSSIDGVEQYKPECLNLSPYVITQGVAIVLLDLYIFILPLPTVFRLQLSTGKRLAVVAVFLTATLGVLAGVCAMVLRIVTLHTSDSGYAQAQLDMCFSVENYVAVIVSCAAAIFAFTQRYILPTKFGEVVRSKVFRLSKSSQPSDDACHTPPSDAASSDRGAGRFRFLPRGWNSRGSEGRSDSEKAQTASAAAYEVQDSSS